MGGAVGAGVNARTHAPEALDLRPEVFIDEDARPMPATAVDADDE